MPILSTDDVAHMNEDWLDRLCWIYAPCYHGAPGAPREAVASALKMLLKNGKLVIDVHPDGNSIRVTPSVLNPARGAA